jgi:Ca2+-binding RTX toxin-like protein
MTLTGGSSAFNYLQGNSNGGDVLAAGPAQAATIVSEGPGDTVDTGAGKAIVLLSGTSGTDTVNLSSGASTVSITGAAHGLLTGNTGSLLFIGGSSSSTVIGGTGTETLYGGAGGGYFTAGSAGPNVLVGGAGAATLTGAPGSYVQGDDEVTSTPDKLIAGLGNETLAGGTGNDTMVGSPSGTDAFTFISANLNQTYEVLGYHTGDLLYLRSAADVNNALTSQSNQNTFYGQATVLNLGDGTKIYLTGFSGALTNSDFGHS